MKNEALLSIEDLHTYFDTDDGVVKAVDGITLSLKAGETLCLVGESGCGKSVTSLSVMRLIQQPPGKIAKGKIWFDGKDLVKLSDKEMRKIRGNKISMIFQEPMTSLNPVLTNGRQIAEVFQLHQGLSKSDAFEGAVKMLKKVGLPDPEKRVAEYPYQISGGMRQRVMIAMALACNPSLVIADEPTTALDVTIQAQILELMNNLKQELNTSILLITHDLGVVAEMAEQVAVMYAGKIVEHTDVNRLFDEPGHPYTKGLMRAIPKMSDPVAENKTLLTIPGTVPSLLNLPVGCSYRDRCDCAFDRCAKATPPLFEINRGHHIRCWLYDE